MFKKIIMILVIAALALSSAVIYAADTANMQQDKAVSKKWEAKRQELYKELDLTVDQQKALEENKKKHMGETKTLFGQMKETRSKIRQELQKDTLDMTKLTQLNNELKNLQVQMLDRKLEGILEVRKILTPEQFKKFTEKMEARKGHFKGKHEKLGRCAE